VNFDAIFQLLIIYTLFVKYCRKVKVYWGSMSVTYRFWESLSLSHWRNIEQYFHWIWYTPQIRY